MKMLTFPRKSATPPGMVGNAGQGVAARRLKLTPRTLAEQAISAEVETIIAKKRQPSGHARPDIPPDSFTLKCLEILNAAILPETSIDGRPGRVAAIKGERFLLCPICEAKNEIGRLIIRHDLLLRCEKCEFVEGEAG